MVCVSIFKKFKNLFLNHYIINKKKKKKMKMLSESLILCIKKSKLHLDTICSILYALYMLPEGKLPKMLTGKIEI